MKPPAPEAPDAPKHDGDAMLPPAEHWLTAFPLSIFWGRDGLRAVWGVIVFLLAFAGLSSCFAPLAHFFYPKGTIILPMAPGRLFLVEGISLFCAAIATLTMARLERRPVAAYGFQSRSCLRNFALGLITGLVLLSLLVLLLHTLGLLAFDARLLSAGAALCYAAVWLFGFLLVGLLEEVLGRGYLQFTLTRGLIAVYRWLFGPRYANALGFWTAATALSYCFGAGHGSNSGESPLGLLAAGLAGFLFCFSLWRTGSLWWAIGFHTSWDWAQSFLYGVPDSGLLVQHRLFATHALGTTWLSGGLTGPEGSILFLPVALAGAAIIVITLPATHHGYIAADNPEPAAEQRRHTSVLP
ncbi:MAG TPA: CPBP family glutamic-type intramembrane protease [Acidobacteriaceae bacterium]|nr:CPBP family glutamic-type intramembrane protease [Acidobacteriaceae bacterium]